MTDAAALTKLDGEMVEGSTFYNVIPFWDDAAGSDQPRRFLWTVYTARRVGHPPGTLVWCVFATGLGDTESEAVTTGSDAADARALIESERNTWLNHPTYTSLTIEPTTRRELPHAHQESRGFDPPTGAPVRTDAPGDPGAA